MRRVLVLLVSVSLALRVATAGATEPLRILPLGDSITHGVCCGVQDGGTATGYRQALRNQLVADGLTVDMVGSLTSGPPGGDNDHEGHDGYATWDLLPLLPEWLQAAQPDVVLLMAGTNDLARADFAPGAIHAATQGLGLMVDAISAEAPNADIYVAQIPPIDFKEPWWPDVIASFNARAEAVVLARQAAGRRVTWVPMAWQLSLISDRVHPNAAGYQMMADSWFGALSARSASQRMTACCSAADRLVPSRILAMMASDGRAARAARRAVSSASVRSRSAA